jgi:hypothetical protein
MKLSLALISTALAMLIAGCHAATLRSLGLPDRNRSLHARVGDPIEINLGTLGGGEFSSPPEISRGVVRFVDVAQVMPPSPAGPIQTFRFVAVARGDAVVTFRHTESTVVVRDTIIVH